MNFLIPCDDIIGDIDKDNESLCVNKTLVIIGYQETHWMNNTPIKECTFCTFKSLLNNDDNITIDNIVYIKYIDIFLWHKTNRIDRIYGSGNSQKSEKWDKIKNKYLHHYVYHDNNIKEETKDENPSKSMEKIILNIDKNPAQLPGQQQKRRYYYWNNKAENIINNGFYEISDKNDSCKTTKINVEKILKKSYKKTKLYHHSTTFKFLTGKQLDNVYRNYENMEINIMNESPLNSIYRLNMEKDKIFKKICVLNVYGEQNNFTHNCTLNHSLNRYNYDFCADKSDEASQYLYSNTMVYSPNCIFFNDLNGNLVANYFKVSFVTAYPVNYNEFMRIKGKMFNESVFDHFDDNIKKKYKNKSKKKIKEENKDYIYKLNEMKEKINEIMRDRIRRMIEIAIYNGCDCVVFNAFGCNQGFGNDIKEIAHMFADFIKHVYFNCFKAIIFTILDKSVRNQRGSNMRKGKDLIMSKFEIFEQTFQDTFP